MGLLDKFNAATKDDNFRIADNQFKYGDQIFLMNKQTNASNNEKAKQVSAAALKKVVKTQGDVGNR